LLILPGEAILIRRFTFVRHLVSIVCGAPGRILLSRVLVSAFVFTNIAKFSRAFDEPALSSCSFFASCSLITKAVDFSARHLGCFAFGILAELTGGGSVSARFFIHEN
jgi:hypothetical protein